MSRIVLKNINKSYNKTKVLDNINLEVEEGEIISLLGPSGCGKTTTLKIIAGLVKQESGSIFLGDMDITNLDIEKRGTVIVFQDHLLFPHLNVEENIGFGLRMAKASKIEIKKQVERMLELVQLKGYNKKYPHSLSGGQKQRVALARALAIEPKVLLLDEPFSNLDSRLREDMRELTLSIQRKLKITTILVTHDKEEAMISSDKIALMLGGSIKQFGTPEEIYERPNSIKAANFMGDRNYISGFISEGRFISDLIEFDVNLMDTKEVKAMIKPEDIRVLPINHNGFEAEILSRKYAGDKVYYKALALGREFKISSPSSMIYREGERVKLEFVYGNITLFKRGDEDFVRYTC